MFFRFTLTKKFYIIVLTIFHGGCFMENTKLFQVVANGYNCTQVDEYIRILKEEYKKVYDYAKAKDTLVAKTNERLDEVQKENEVLSVEASRLVEKVKQFGAQLAQNVSEAEKTDEKIKQLEAQLAQMSSAPAVAAQEPQDNSVLLRSISTMTMLSEEIVRENRELRKRVEALENK